MVASMKTIKIGGFDAKVSSEKKSVIFSTPDGFLFSKPIPCENRVSSPFFVKLIQEYCSESNINNPNITEITVIHTRSCSYNFRTKMVNRSGTYSTESIYHQKDGKWTLHSKKIENKIY